MEGSVKWFNDSKGYGFIEADSGHDVFVHHSSIEGEGFKSLAEGDRVGFVEEKGTKGPRRLSENSGFGWPKRFFFIGESLSNPVRPPSHFVNS